MCAVVYKISNVQCQYFLVLNIPFIQKVDSGHSEIALKINLPQNQCPASNPLTLGPNYLTQIISSKFFKTTVSYSNHGYNLTYNLFLCPKNTKMFQRGETTVVCIGLFFFEEPICNNQAEASALCKAHNGTLTGPANSDEYEYMRDISNSSKYTSNPKSYSYLTYWIDGKSTNTEFSFEDPTHNGSTNYPWSGGTPQSTPTGSCLYHSGPDSYVLHGLCSFTICCKDEGYICWRGALCQVPPIDYLY
ncbi:hypothetical protein B9Z55_007636 [Caenorhabditis nigoni]|nr:hypothetical protein B9Z55_007636 [Caenorhabditis nigoni]